LNQEDINHLNRSITSNELKAVIKSLNKVNPRTRQTFKKEITLLKLFYEIERQVMLPNSIYEASVALIPKTAKNTKKRKLKINFLDENSTLYTHPCILTHYIYITLL
jgi:hypothetical protein